MIKAENELNKPKYTGMLVLWAMLWGVIFTLMSVSYLADNYPFTMIWSAIGIFLSILLYKMLRKEEREYNNKQMQEDNKKINKHNKRISKQMGKEQNGKKARTN